MPLFCAHVLKTHKAEVPTRTQYGFHVGRSSEQTILLVRTLIKEIWIKKEFGFLLVDKQKAFDSGL